MNTGYLSYLLLEPDAFQFSILFLLIAATVLQYRKKARLCLLIAVGFTAARCAWEIVITHGAHKDFLQYFLPVAHYTQSWKSIFWLLAPLPLLHLSREWIQRIGWGLFLLASVVTAWFDIFGPPQEIPSYWRQVGLLYNPSMNPALIACLFPFTKSWKWKLRIIAEIWTLYVVLDCRHMTPMLVYLAMQTSGFIFDVTWRWKVIFLTGLISAVFLLPLGIPALDWHAHSSLRYPEYLFFWNQFLEHWSLWWGMGIGKFAIYGPLLQAVFENKTSDFWYFLHSDWMELLLQQGIVGTALWLWVYAEVLWRGFKKMRVLFEVTLGMSAFMLSYFPLHVSSSAIVAILCLHTLRK